MSEDKHFGNDSTADGSAKSRFELMAAQFQQKQMQEKEQKLLQMIDNQQQRAMQKANLSGVIPSKFTTNNSTMKSSSSWANNTQSTITSQNRTSPINPIAPGKVRQMFEERRKGGPITNGNGVKAGIDKSYPLDPIVVDSNNSKIRTVSSKSDPNYPNRPSRPPPVPQPTSKSVRQLPSRLTPTPPNLGSTNRQTQQSPRGISLDRNTSSRNSSGNSSSGGSLGLRRSSSGFNRLNSPQDENGNELNNPTMTRSTPSPVIPKTTKYKDYVANTTVQSRENSLGLKMKQLNISSPTNSASSGINKALGSEKESPVPKAKSSASSPKKLPASRLNSNKSTSSAGSSTSPTKVAERSGPPAGSVECRVCHRYFVSDRIAKHESICKATSAKKRKVFDPTKMRLQGTEAEPYLRQVSGKGKKNVNQPTKAPKKADWRKKHEDFINTIRAAKVYQQHVAAGGNPADLPPPPPTDTSDYIQCPHCGRKFNEAAANRHIPKCQSIKSNKR